MRSLPPAMGPAMMMGGPALAADGGQAAMAQLLAMRSEVLTMHLSVQLFHCTPQELPEDAQEQLTAWLRSAPACAELYIRSGCMHLTLTVSSLPTMPACPDLPLVFSQDQPGSSQPWQATLRGPVDVWPAEALFGLCALSHFWRDC